MSPTSRGRAGAEDGRGTSRVPSALGSIPLVGDLVKGADAQAQWLADLLEQNARLLGQLPDTLRSYNDALERFNQTVAQLDRSVTRIEKATKTLTGPIDRLAGALDPATLRDLPETLDALRREAVPALRAATDTQHQVASLQLSVERVISVIADLPGMGIVRRLTTGRGEDAATPADPARPKPPQTAPRS